MLRSVPPSEYVKGGRFPGKAGRGLQRLILERRYGMPPERSDTSICGTSDSTLPVAYGTTFLHRGA